jgi:hypothetical protein
VPTSRAPVDSAVAAPARRYVRDEALGRGAWGVVYLARDSVIDRVVALKEITFDPSLDEAERQERGTRSVLEARAAGALNHPNIVTIYDAGLGDDGLSFFIVMEYVEGMTLRERLASGPLPLAEAARIGAQVAAGLDHAHSLGIVHRDVKPANVLIRRDGLAKIADFGIAKMDASDLTRTGETLGSPAYMSPEQAMGQSVDYRTDIFSGGVLLYQMVTGRRPFESDSAVGFCYRIVHETPPPPSSLRTDLGAGWDACIMKAMAKRPEDRHASAAELASELERLGRGERPVVGEPAGAGAPAPAPVPGESGSCPGTDPPERDGPLTLLEETAAAGHGRAPSSGAGPWSPRRRRLLAGIGAVLLALALGMVARAVLSEAPPDASLRVEVQHGIPEGEVSVAVDGRNVWSQAIAAARTGGRTRAFLQKLSGRPAGRAAGDLRIPSGEHTITVAVTAAGEDRPWSASERRHFEPDSETILEVEVLSGLTRGLELNWE